MPNIATISGNMLTESVVDLATLPSGSGTSGYLPKWATTTSLGNSLVFDNGTNVGIGTTSPGNLGSSITTLSINGRDDAFTGGIWLRSSANSVRGYIYGTSSLFTIGSETSQPMTFQTAASERMRIAANGRVLINSTTDVGNYGLQVNGANLYVRGTANDNNTTVLQISNAAGSSLLQMRTDAHTYLGGLEFNRGGSGTIYGSSVDVVFTAYAALENLRCNFYAGVVVNEGGRGDVYFRVEGDTDANLLYTAPATDRIGIGTNSPGYKLDVNGTSNFAGATRIFDSELTMQKGAATGDSRISFKYGSTEYGFFSVNTSSGVVSLGGATYGVSHVVLCFHIYLLLTKSL